MLSNGGEGDRNLAIADDRSCVEHACIDVTVCFLNEDHQDGLSAVGFSSSLGGKSQALMFVFSIFVVPLQLTAMGASTVFELGIKSDFRGCSKTSVFFFIFLQRNTKQ